MFGTVQPREFVSVPAEKLLALLDAMDEAEREIERLTDTMARMR